MSIHCKNINTIFNSFFNIRSIRLIRNVHAYQQVKDRIATEEATDLEWKNAKPFKQIPGKSHLKN